MKLMISTDLGVTYSKAGVGSYQVLKKVALDWDRGGGCRWVIVNNKDEPKFWCNYIEQQVQTAADTETAIASRDKYVIKLARKKGMVCMDGKEFFNRMGIDPDKLPTLDLNPRTIGKVLEGMERLTNEGLLNEIESTVDDSKVGEELFGELREVKEEEKK